MTDFVHIRMFGGFSLFVNNVCMDQVVAKSKKGLTLLQYLILHCDASEPNAKLIEALWPNEESSNPENALKTLVSRFRTILNQCCPQLGTCIAASRGGYQFTPLHGMTIDLFEFREMAENLEGCQRLTPESRLWFQRILTIYTGDLLAGNDQEEWAVSVGVALHDQYIRLIYRYVTLLQEKSEYEEIIQTCRFALETDPFDERLHLELMQALVKTNRSNEALMQYKHVTNMHFRYLGVKPPESIQEFYQQIMQTGSALDTNLDSVRTELQEYGENRGAFECDYAVFREIYNLQMRNLQRLGSNMYLAMIMITSLDGEPMDPLKLDDIMKGLSAVLRGHLRKGDTITHCAPAQYALLLPTINADTGRMIMERIKRLFYQRYPNSSVMFSYRLGPLGETGLNLNPAAERRPGERPKVK